MPEPVAHGKWEKSLQFSWTPRPICRIFEGDGRVGLCVRCLSGFCKDFAVLSMAFEGFFDIIQAYFMHLTGRFIFFSGRDMSLLEEWRAQGASAATICRGVRDAVRAMARTDPPRSMYNCRDFIEPYIQRQRARRVPLADPTAAAAPATPPTPQIARRALARLERAGGSCHDDAIRMVYRQAWYQTRALAGAQLEEQYCGLLELESHLADHYFQALPDHVQSALRARVVGETGRILATMEPHARALHLEARTRYHLVRDHGLIPLLD